MATLSYNSRVYRGVPHTGEDGPCVGQLPRRPHVRLNRLARQPPSFEHHQQRCRYETRRPLRHLPQASSAAAEPEPSQPSQPAATGFNAFAALSVAAVVVLGVTNRVLYKLALVPMQNYVFFLAQLQVFGYLLVYLSLLYLRYRAGKVTPAMLQLPKKPFALIGGCEAIAQLMLLVGAAKLPAPVLPLLMQTSMVWSLLFARIILGTRFQVQQVLGCLLVLAGVVLASAPSSASSMRVDPYYAAIMVASFAFPALSVIIKERVFKQAEVALGGQKLDVLVINAFGSSTQAFFVLCLLPITTALRGLPLATLPEFLHQGGRCFMGLQPSCGGDCSGAPLLPVAYVAVNICFNIAVVSLLRRIGAVPMSLAMSSVVPLTIIAFTLPLPYLDPVALSAGFWGGTALLMLGLLLYNWQSWCKAAQGKLA